MFNGREGEEGDGCLMERGVGSLWMFNGQGSRKVVDV